MSGDVSLADAPVLVTTVFPVPDEPAMCTFAQLPSTTLEALWALISPDVNGPPTEPMKVPASEDCAAAGVSFALVRFLPQTTIVTVAPPAACLFAAGHGDPGVAGAGATTAARTWNEYADADGPAPCGVASDELAMSYLSVRATRTSHLPVKFALASLVVARSENAAV